MWKVIQTEKFEKKLGKLPKHIQKKSLKQLRLLQADFRHPSLHTKKQMGDTWEVRVDFHYRFTFEILGEQLILKSVGMHDEGLGKK